MQKRYISLTENVIRHEDSVRSHRTYLDLQFDFLCIFCI